MVLRKFGFRLLGLAWQSSAPSDPYQTLKMHLDFGGKLSKNHFFVYTMSYYLPWRIQLQTAEEIIVRRRPCMT